MGAIKQTVVVLHSCPYGILVEPRKSIGRRPIFFDTRVPQTMCQELRGFQKKMGLWCRRASRYPNLVAFCANTVQQFRVASRQRNATNLGVVVLKLKAVPLCGAMRCYEAGFQSSISSRQPTAALVGRGWQPWVAGYVPVQLKQNEMRGAMPCGAGARGVAAVLNNGVAREGGGVAGGGDATRLGRAPSRVSSRPELDTNGRGKAEAGGLALLRAGPSSKGKVSQESLSAEALRVQGGEGAVRSRWHVAQLPRRYRSIPRSCPPS